MQTRICSRRLPCCGAKELEGVVNPIMMKVYQAAGGGGGMPEGGMPGGGFGGGDAPGGASGPTVEEVD